MAHLNGRFRTNRRSNSILAEASHSRYKFVARQIWRDKRAINSAARVPSSHGGSHWFESSIAQSRTLNANVIGSKPLQNRGFFVACLFRVQGLAYRFNAVLHTGVHTICTHGLLKMGVENLKVVLLGDPFAVAEPSCDNVAREGLRQFCLTGASQVVPCSGPCDQSRSLDDLAELRPDVD